MLRFKKHFCLAITTLIISQLSYAQPKAIVAEPIKEMGSVYQEDLLETDFIVKNDGNAPLVITDVRAACGCTATTYDKEIAPGRTGKVHAKVNISTFNGIISKDIMLFTNDINFPQIKLTIEARILRRANNTPAYVRLR